MNEFIDKVIAQLRKGWCQRSCARNAFGDETGPDEADAVSWCVYGAATITNRAALETLYQKVHGVNMITDNDTQGMTVGGLIHRLEMCKT